MSFNVKSIVKETRNLPPRIVLLGTEKVGKSTFVSQIPNVTILPVKGETGLDKLLCHKFPVAQTYDDVMEAITSLAMDEHEHKFFGLDSTSTFERLVWEHTCKCEGWSHIEKPGYGKGYTVSLSHWQRILDGLDYLREVRGMGIILTGHVKTSLFNDPQFEPYDTFVWDVKENAANLMMRWADCILFARPKLFIKQVGEGFRFISEHFIFIHGIYLSCA